jgi:signal transduction histidine kinase
MMRSPFIFICFYFLTIRSLAQPFVVHNYSIPEGMPSSETYDVFQDSRGFMWFATDNGVVKFDGYEMTVFNTSNGLEDPVVFGIMEDHRGRVWFRTHSGRLFYYEREKIWPYKFNDLLIKACSKSIMTSMFVDSKEQLWFTTTIEGRINAEGTLFVDSIPARYMVYRSVEEGHILGCFVKLRDQERYVDIDGKVFSMGKYDYKYGSAVERSIRWRNRLYISSSNSVYEYDGTSLKCVLQGSSLIISLSTDADDNLWVGYYNIGAERYSDTQFKKPWTPNFVKTKSVSQIRSDREGGLWVTTLEHGVFYVPEINIGYRPHSDSSKIKTVAARGDEVVIGTFDGTVKIIDAKFEQPVIKKELYIKKTMAVFLDSRRNIWVSAGPLFFCDKDLGTCREEYQGNSIVDFAEDKKGYVWAVSSRGRIWKFDRNAKLRAAEYSGPSQMRNMLFADSIIYVAERLGLHVYDSSMNFLEAPASLAKFKISKLLSLNDSILFVATVGNGFLLVNKHHWTINQFNSRHQSIADNVYAAEKRDTAIWMGTEKGVLIAGMNSMLKGDPYFVHLAKGSGLISNKIDFIAHTQHSALAFTDEGISTIAYSAVRTERRLPEFYFKKLFIHKEAVEFGQDMKLPHDRADIELTFGFLSLKNQNILCRYRLAKEDPWIFTTERKVQFYSLAPGQYAFEIEYSIDNLHWKRADSVLQFLVTPPWWQRWYVMLMAVLVMGFLSYLYFRNHYRTLQEHQKKLVEAEIETLERERNRIAKELHDGVATNLSAIKLMVNHLLNAHQEPLAEELDEHFLHTIKEIKGVIYGLTPPGLEHEGLFSGLKNYVEKLNRTLPIKIHLKTTGSEIHRADLGLLSFRIIQELLSNAVKHSQAKNITIQLTSNGDQLHLEFLDDGIGFSKHHFKPGLGLGNVKSRVESARGLLKFESGAAGTSFTITIPLT